VRRYVDGIDFGRDEVVGIFDASLELVAMAHLARIEGENGAAPMAEFGVSVLPRARGRGWGSRLFERAVLHARNWGAEMMIIHALSENTPMLRIARKAGATIEREGGEAQALLRLPPKTPARAWTPWWPSRPASSTTSSSSKRCACSSGGG
jgi:GNAT superfamily N-acetyltransferase